MRVYRRLLGYVLPYWPIFGISTLGYLLVALSQGGAAWYIGLVIGHVSGTSVDFGWFMPLVEGAEDQLGWYIAAGIPVLFALRGVGNLVGSYSLVWMGERLVQKLRIEIFSQLIYMPVDYFEKHDDGQILSRVTYTVSQVSVAAIEAVRTLLREGLTALGLLGFMLYMNWQLTLLFVLLTPPVALIVLLSGRFFRRYSKRLQNVAGTITQSLSEVLQAYEVIKSFGGQMQERRRFRRAIEYSRQQKLKMELMRLISTPLIQIIVSIALSIVLAMILAPELIVGTEPIDKVRYITAAGLLPKSIRQLSLVYSMIQKGIVAARDIFAQLDMPVEQNIGTHVIDRVEGRIEFKSVSFSYPQAGVRQQRRVLKNINLVLEPGETVALVGRSGAGKTTMLKLVQRFISPDEGEILLDGIPMNDYQLGCLRRQVASVGQQVVLFNDSVVNNICYGGLFNASREKLEQVMEWAHASEFVQALPQGMDTVLGDRGVTLSGGQRQRLAIARALLKDAPVLILDEATSALDSESESYVQEALSLLMKKCTTLMIAHRLTTVENADRILVMDDGEIIESGTHRELMAANQHYAALYSSGMEQGSPTPAVEEALEAQVLMPLGTGVLVSETHVSKSETRLMRFWHGGGSRWAALLVPLGWIYQGLVAWRRRYFRRIQQRLWQPPVPVIVIGNITAGGTGKTPVVSWLASQLRTQGYKPGLVLRGYLGSGGFGAPYYPYRVDAESAPATVGDEAVMLIQQTGCPVCVAPDRVSAVRELIDECDIIIADDGLQHYSLKRDMEIAVVDGVRGFGNGRLMPAGPLREPTSRLREVDMVLCNGSENTTGIDGAICFGLRPDYWMRLSDGALLPLQQGPSSREVHAVAALGNPLRFIRTLRSLGFVVHEHIFPDHHLYQPDDVKFDDELPILMTVKDAVKCRHMGLTNAWALGVEPQNLEPVLERVLLFLRSRNQA